MEESFTLTTPDGYPLAATLYPGGARGIVIGGAMAVARKFYAALARYLQAQGYTVLTFDYRGIGDSFPVGGTLRGFQADVTTWALQDLESALRHMKSHPGVESLHLIGHSLGGQILGMTETAPEIKSAVTLSSQSGYWRLQGGREPLKVLFHMYVTFPILTRLVGYMPWSKFAKARDVPKGAALQWSSWCRHPAYLFGDSSLPLHRYANVKADILAMSIEDDDWGSRRSVDEMMSHYPNTTRRHLEPREFGRKAIGHFSFFKAGNEDMWALIPEWLERGR
jgi:predicted alpha/beta hydrolase